LNIRAALVAAGLGAAFFAAELTFRLYPDFELSAIFSNNDSKARAAVSRLLINPSSAQFGELRSVKEEAAKYVCGEVKAKDKTGQYAGYRAFVYTVASDFARIDDDGQIAQKHAAFRTCPLSDEEKVAQQNLQISPGTLSMVKSIQKVLPTADPSTLSTMASQMSAGGERSSGGTLEQQTGQMARQLTARLPAASQSGSAGPSSSPGGPQENSTFKAALGNETEWRGDRPPAAWPIFPMDHPLARSAQKRTTAQAMAFAKEVEDRWEQSKSGNTKARPSSEEIQEACRALLAIDPKNEEFPKAWAAFVRLRKIGRDTAT
jgi:hypothetical protein